MWKATGAGNDKMEKPERSVVEYLHSDFSELTKAVCSLSSSVLQGEFPEGSEGSGCEAEADSSQ